MVALVSRSMYVTGLQK